MSRSFRPRSRSRSSLGRGEYGHRHTSPALRLPSASENEFYERLRGVIDRHHRSRLKARHRPHVQGPFPSSVESSPARTGPSVPAKRTRSRGPFAASCRGQLWRMGRGRRTRRCSPAPRESAPLAVTWSNNMRMARPDRQGRRVGRDRPSNGLVSTPSRGASVS